MRKFLLVALLLMLLLGGGIVNYFAWANSWTFQGFDLWIDSGNRRLVAYQVEINYDRRLAKIVGLEGGSCAAYRQPPYYDSQGFAGGRIIVAAFTTAHAIAPQGRIRVARIHIATNTSKPLRIIPRLMTAASPGGKRIDVIVQLEKAR